MVNIADVML